jgi:predicted glutamine amidotransferase
VIEISTFLYFRILFLFSISFVSSIYSSRYQPTMCQLMGMNCNVPTDFTFSFKGFAKRGGETDKHEHGWGLAIYEGRGLRTFHDSLPAAKSSIADFVSKYPIQTLNMMAHIRYATQGTVSLENVHPFQREMWGIQWSFAHNGEVPKFTGKSLKEYPRLRRCKELFYHPVGETDSEAVFCAILNALRTEFVELPTLPNLYETIQRLCAEIVQGEEDTTILNFLLGCG